MKRTQLVRPILCHYACVLEQEWDDEDAVPNPVTVAVHGRCSRHKGMAAKQLERAVQEEAERFNAVAADLEAHGISPSSLEVAVADDGVLEIALPKARRPAALALKGVRFR